MAKGNAAQLKIGFTDQGSSGGYESENLDEGLAQREANSEFTCHGGAGDAKAESQPNKVGGKYAGT